MKTFIASLWFFLAASGFAGAFGASLVVDLRFEAEEALPYVPLSFTVTVTNPGPDIVALLNELRIRDTTKTQTFLALWGETQSDYVQLTTERGDLNLQSGETRKFRFSTDRLLSEPALYFDSRVSSPGTHKFEALVRPTASNTYTFSKVETVHHRLATAADAEVVAYMESLPGLSFGWDNREWIELAGDVANFAWKNHPSSGYIEYVALFVNPPSPKERFSVIEEVAAREGKTPFHDDLLMMLGDWYADFARTNLVSNEAAAKRFSDRALMKFETAAKNSSDEDLRHMAIQKAQAQAEWYARAVRAQAD